MPLFDMKNMTRQHLQELIANKVFENKELEYKDYTFANGKMTDKHKDKLMKEIAAFTNTNGGTIIIGMQEDENSLHPVLDSLSHAFGFSGTSKFKSQSVEHL